MLGLAVFVWMWIFKPSWKKFINAYYWLKSFKKEESKREKQRRKEEGREEGEEGRENDACHGPSSFITLHGQDTSDPGKTLTYVVVIALHVKWPGSLLDASVALISTSTEVPGTGYPGPFREEEPELPCHKVVPAGIAGPATGRLKMQTGHSPVLGHN